MNVIRKEILNGCERAPDEAGAITTIIISPFRHHDHRRANSPERLETFKGARTCSADRCLFLSLRSPAVCMRLVRATLDMQTTVRCLRA